MESLGRHSFNYYRLVNYIKIMKTINIKGKEYVPVVERVKELHRVYPDRCDIKTKIVSSDEIKVVVSAEITIYPKADEPILTFTGHSQAEWGKGMMGGVALEVAETSAIGRALGFANIGLIDGIASADEIRKVGGKSFQAKNKEDFDAGVDPF